jgi:hypothetical protein
MPQWLKWNKGGRWEDNDEGFHMKFCYTCGKNTEHDLRNCVPCINRNIAKRYKKD